MKQFLTRSIQFILCLLAGLLLLWLAFRGMDFAQIADKFRHADYRWVWFSLLFGVCSHVARSCRWRLMCTPFGRTPSFFHTLCAVMTGYIINFVFPRAGEVARCVALRKTDGLPFEKLIGTVVAERAVDLLCVLLMLGVLLACRFDFFGTFLADNLMTPLQARMGGHAGLILTTAVIVCVLLLILAFRHLRKSGNNSQRRIAKLWNGLLEGLFSVFRMPQRGQFLLFTILLWTAYFLQTYVVFFAVPATQALHPVDAIFVLAMCSLGFALPVQGGIGAYHWVVSLSLMLYGIAREDGLIYATIAHTSGSLLTIFMGFLALIAVGVIRRKSSNPQQNPS